MLFPLLVLFSLTLSAAADRIVYGHADGEPLTMRYYPAAGLPPYPVVIIPAGAPLPFGADKARDEDFLARLLAPAGYAVFLVSYRAPSKYPYPAMVEDIERAIGFIRQNARRWDIHPKRLALVGSSTGGYLVNLVALRGVEEIQAAVSFCGASDFRAWDPDTPALRAAFGHLYKAKGPRKALAEVSPVMYLRSGAPPFLLIHGDRDATVPLNQAVHLQAALHSAGVACDLIIIHNGGHGLMQWLSLPQVRSWEMELIRWLNRILRHASSAG